MTETNLNELIENCRTQLYKAREEYKTYFGGDKWPYGTGKSSNDDLAEIQDIGNIQIYDQLIDIYNQHFPEPDSSEHKDNQK